MKIENVMVLATVLVLLGLAGMGAMKKTIGQQQQEIAIQQAEIDQAEAWRYWTQIAALPPPYRHPLDQLWVSSGVGYRMDPMGGATESLHKGVDLVGPVGAPIVAVLAGVVVEHWLTPGEHWGKMYYGHPVYGCLIVIDHGNGLFTLYGHLSESYVHEGWRVEAGQVIGRLGDTGITTGPHLHFECVIDGLKYLAERR